MDKKSFYSHVNYSVTKIITWLPGFGSAFYSHVNYSVTKIYYWKPYTHGMFYSHVNYSVTKIRGTVGQFKGSFTVT